MRDHRKLLAFEKADALVLEIYRASAVLPRSEEFGLKTQLRRAALSIASNIVEGCARESAAEFLRFLSIAQGSAKELTYQVSIANRLGLMPGADGERLAQQCEDCVRMVARLRQGFEKAVL